MKITRKATANWKGKVKDGKGTLTTGSHVLKDTNYSFNTRFEDGVGTNPEELVAAAHAGCFTMQLSALLSEEDHLPNHLNTEAKLDFEEGSIQKIHLDLTGDVDNIDEETFLEIAQKAKRICPISKLLNTEIVLNTQLS